MEPLLWQEREQILRLAVRVQPKSSKNAVVGYHGTGAVKISLTAAPVDGKANKALIAFLAKDFHIAKSKVVLLRGDRGRDKLVEISGVDGAGLSAFCQRWKLDLVKPSVAP